MLDDDGDFDTEAFLNVRSDILDGGPDDLLTGASDALMEKFVQALAPPTPSKPPAYPLPPLKQGATPK